MSKFNKCITFLLISVVMLKFFSFPVSAKDVQYRMNISISVNGTEICSIPALDNNYENNLYISLKGLAYCLKDTDKAFNAIVDKKKIDIISGENYPGEVIVWSDDEITKDSDDSAHKYELYFNGNERKYYSFIFTCGGEYDAFLAPVSLAMMLDINMNVSDGKIEIDTASPYSVSMEELEASGYLQDANALVTGDGSTETIFYGFCPDDVYPIASTTKLMSYFVLMDAVSEGKCSLDDMVIISDRAERLSESPDGVVPMTAGMSVPLRELVYGMLLPSSNECAFTVAEYVAGSEEAFVEMMNEKAEELGLTSAEFHNSHGLPSYEDQFIPAKLQNRMSARDMFKLSSALMNTYPQVSDITSKKIYHLDYLGKDVKNTNAVLYNMDNAIGLKTGTTDRAGACLVTCVSASKDGETHNLITVLLGADEDSGRGLISEMASRYSMRTLEYGNLNGDNNITDVIIDNVIPDDPEIVVKRLLKLAGKK